MTIVIKILLDILNEGLMYALLAMGMYITYSILDFPDLSVDGTFPLGAVLSGVLIIQGVDPWLCLLISFAAGMAAGVLTGLMHVKLRITPLLCGIIMYTAMLSVNLVILKAGTGGMAVASFFTKNTIFNSGLASFIPESIGGKGGFYIRTVIIALIIVVVCKILLDLYLRTKHGLLLRATGANDRYTVMLGKNPGSMKIIGLALGNGFAALAGSVIAQNKGSADQQMGVGMVVLGLASVIIGLSLFKRVKFMKGTTMVILGSLVYKAAYQIVLSLGIPTDFNNLMKALIFLIALVLGGSEVKKLIESLRRKPDPVTSKAKLALSNITKVFNPGTVDENKLFDKFTLEINDGDFVSVVGSNGSGKTTMLNVICGGIQPDSGAVIFNGENVALTKEFQRAKRIGRVLQDPKMGTCGSLTILENMALADNKLHSYGLSPAVNKRREEYYKKLLESCGMGLENRMGVLAGSLSGGQRQALALIIATMSDIDLLILDEHTAALDPKSSETLMRITEKVVKEKHLTTLMVTHNLRFAVEYGSRLVMMHNGTAVMDIDGEEKQKLVVDDILGKFNEISIECGN